MPVNWVAVNVTCAIRIRIDRQVPRWLGQLEKYRTRDIPHIDYVAEWLRDHVPPMGEPGIIHGDYQLINHPDYNRDRGPVSLLSARVHLKF